MRSWHPKDASGRRMRPVVGSESKLVLAKSAGGGGCRLSPFLAGAPELTLGEDNRLASRHTGRAALFPGCVVWDSFPRDSLPEEWRSAV